MRNYDCDPITFDEIEADKESAVQAERERIAAKLEEAEVNKSGSCGKIMLLQRLAQEIREGK